MCLIFFYSDSITSNIYFIHFMIVVTIIESNENNEGGSEDAGSVKGLDDDGMPVEVVNQ